MQSCLWKVESSIVHKETHSACSAVLELLLTPIFFSKAVPKFGETVLYKNLILAALLELFPHVVIIVENPPLLQSPCFGGRQNFSQRLVDPHNCFHAFFRNIGILYLGMHFLGAMHGPNSGGIPQRAAEFNCTVIGCSLELLPACRLSKHAWSILEAPVKYLMAPSAPLWVSEQKLKGEKKEESGLHSEVGVAYPWTSDCHWPPNRKLLQPTSVSAPISLKYDPPPPPPNVSTALTYTRTHAHTHR